uniref:Uncharacterized protein n=1 Tax=viral metagenome TaxID=1070528 RepID=A0A6M3ILQ3_9ZZZZ
MEDLDATVTTPPVRKKVSKKDIMADLRYEFTPAEMQSLSMELANEEIRRKRLKDALADVSATYRSKIKSAEMGISERATKISNGFEYRQTECTQIMDYMAGIVTIIRKDLDEVVEERPMSEAEKQVPLI